MTDETSRDFGPPDQSYGYAVTAERRCVLPDHARASDAGVRARDQVVRVATSCLQLAVRVSSARPARGRSSLVGAAQAVVTWPHPGRGRNDAALAASPAPHPSQPAAAKSSAGD